MTPHAATSQTPHAAAKLWIDGASVDALDGATYDDVDPAGAHWARITDGLPMQSARAIRPDARSGSGAAG